MYNSYATPDGLSISIGYILLNLDVNKGLASTQLAPRLGMEPSSMTRILKSMEEKGLIYREADAEDKRQVNIYLTEEGNDKKRKAKKTIKNFNKIIEQEIDEKEIDIFVQVLEKINKLSEQNFLKTT